MSHGDGYSPRPSLSARRAAGRLGAGFAPLGHADLRNPSKDRRWSFGTPGEVADQPERKGKRPPMSPTSLHLMRLRSLSPLAVGLCALALGACGGSGSTSASAASSNSEDRDTARLKLTQCLRENGVDVPDNPGQGNGGQGNGGRRSLSDADREKMQTAMQGPCKEFRQAAGGNISAEDRQAFQDAFQKFAQCMRQNGVDVPDPTQGGGPRGGGARQSLNSDDPDVQAAREKCQDDLPQRGLRGGGGGPGGSGGESQ